MNQIAWSRVYRGHKRSESGSVVFVRHLFFWEDLHSDPRMDKILGAVGL